jgi:hypothetical protein
MEVAERIRARVAGESLPERAMTVSLGVAVYPADGDNAESVIAAADSGLYDAKRGGRNRVVKGGTPVPQVRAKPPAPQVLPTAKPRAKVAAHADDKPAPKSRAKTARKKS